MGPGFSPAPERGLGLHLLIGSIWHDILEEVHILAIKYGWSRNEILDIPNWERVAYIEKLIRDAKEEERMIEEAKRGTRG